MVIAFDWSLPFELVCDANDISMEQFWGQERIRCFIPFTMLVEPLMMPKRTTPQQKKFLEVVFDFDKFRHYLVLCCVGGGTSRGGGGCSLLLHPLPGSVSWLL